MDLLAKLKEVQEKHSSIQTQLNDPEIHSNPQEYQKLAREEATLRPLIEAYQNYSLKNKELAENKELLNEKDESIREMVKEEIPLLEEAIEELEKEIQILLLPTDPNDEKNIFLEIRAGTGGEEAALFAADLFRMYSRCAEKRKWKVEIESSSPTGSGGFKEIIALISGEAVYSWLKYESGIHRVQRVPKTESSGRIHTSAITVAVIPEADEVDVEINPNDLRVDVFRAGGHGGQSVNTTDSAVRLTHTPSGLVVICQDEKSQHKNKAKALKVLRARLYDQILQEQMAAEAKERKEQVKSGDRSEKIRTYNFPQTRVTDHRIGLTLHQLDAILDGDLDELIQALRTHFQTEALKVAS